LQLQQSRWLDILVSGIENELSMPENMWPCFALKELADNAYDWLNDYYPISNVINRRRSYSSSSINYNSSTTRTRYIALRIQIDKIANDADLTRVFRIAVRNSNVDQIGVFGGGLEGLEQIFDYTQWLSTKRHQHRVVKWLQENGYADIRLEDVEEEYAPNPKLFRSQDDLYLQTKRIELDSIIQKVGPEASWKYIVHRLEAQFPGPRDYREIVPEPKPEDYYPDEINDHLEYIAKCVKQVYTPKWREIKESQLKEVKGLLRVDDKKAEIDESLRHIVQEEDKGIQKIIAKLEELREFIELSELNEEEGKD
jgi:hypothetical protein